MCFSASASLPCLQFNRGQVRQRDAVVLVALQNFLVVRLGLVEFVTGKMLLRGGDQFRGAGRHFADGFIPGIGIGRLWRRTF